jgi:hypothetical protein
MNPVVHPINLTTTTHRLAPVGDLLRCPQCGAEFKPEAGANFAWPLTEGATQECQPLPRHYRALSTKQPWAGMIARGEKDLEIRSQQFHYRGELLICAGQKADDLKWLPRGWPAHEAAKDPLGVAICLVELYDCRPMRRDDVTRAGCPHAPGLWALCLRNPRPVKPVLIKGMLGLMNVSVALELG